MIQEGQKFSGGIGADFPKSPLGIYHPPEGLWEKNIPRTLRNTIATLVFSLVSCVPNDGVSQNDSCKLGQQSIESTPILNDQGDYTDMEYALLRCYPDIKIKIFFPDEYEMQEYGYSLDDYKVYMQIIQDKNFLEFTLPIFQDIFETYGIMLGGIDYIPFADLYMAQKNKNSNEIELLLERITQGYSAFDMDQIFIKRGIKSI